jgi:hypothetical protein
VSFAAITLCVASLQMFIVVTYFFIYLVRELLDTPSYYGTHVARGNNLTISAKIRINRPEYQTSYDVILNIK